MQLSNKKIQFKPSILPTLAALVMIALTLYLSNWQTSRAAQKAALQSIYDARATLVPVKLNSKDSLAQSSADVQQLRFRQASISGEWLIGQQFVVDNKQQNGAAGYHVITPLRLAETRDNSPAVSNIDGTKPIVVLVNRGWVPRTRNYPLLPKIAPPPQMDSYTGVLVSPSKKYLELGASQTAIAAQTATTNNSPPPKIASDQVWQNLDVDRIAAATGLNLFPLVMLLNSNAPQIQPKPPTPATDAVISPVEQIETPDAGVEKHRGYAFQWLALAIAIALVWFVVNTKISRVESA